MSHFTKIKTKLVIKEHLIQALKDLGHRPQEGQVSIRGWHGQKTSVEVMIPTKNKGYDIGFQKSDGVYELVADWYGIKDIKSEAFINTVQQRYSYHAVVSRMAEKGFEIVEEENTEDNTIHLTVRRAVF